MRHQLQNPKRAVSRQFAVSTAFLALPLLFLVPAKAQTQDAVSPKNAAVEAKTKAKVDPKARLVLERMFAAYKNAKTLRDVVEFRVTGEPLGGLENSRITIASDRSGERKKLMVTKVAGGTTSMAVTDGVTLYATRSSDPAHYLKLDSESSVWQTWGQDSTYVFPAINATMPGLTILFGERGVDGLVKDGMTSLSLGEPQIVGGAIA